MKNISRLRIFPYTPLDASDVFVVQARSKLAQLHESQQEAHRSLEQYDEALDGASLTNLADLSEGVSLTERGGFGTMVKVE